MTEGRDEIRYFRLGGLLFRVHPNRLERGAEYLRNAKWVPTPITSGSVIHNPSAHELSPDEAARYTDIV